MGLVGTSWTHAPTSLYFKHQHGLLTVVTLSVGGCTFATATDTANSTDECRTAWHKYGSVGQCSSVLLPACKTECKVCRGPFALSAFEEPWGVRPALANQHVMTLTGTSLMVWFSLVFYRGPRRTA